MVSFCAGRSNALISFYLKSNNFASLLIYIYKPDRANLSSLRARPSYDLTNLAARKKICHNRIFSLNTVKKYRS